MYLLIKIKYNELGLKNQRTKIESVILLIHFSIVDKNNAKVCNFKLMRSLKIFIYSLFLFLNFSFLEAKTAIMGDELSGYQLSVNGYLYDVKGVAGEKKLELLKAFGGNTIRTWSIDKRTLDKAHKLGLKVVAGIWVQHMRHDDKYDYTDPKFIRKQRKKVENLVKKFKDHPALLAWGLGNEVELHVPDNLLGIIWDEMNTLAKIVKSIDGNHPIMTAVAGFDSKKIDDIKLYYPECDILGVNAYGFAPKVGDLLLEYGWGKPYMITEFGPMGPWEVDEKCDWGAVIEETSHDKAKRYLNAYLSAMNKTPRHCLGAFPFYWSSKQETTTTWFGMFLNSGARLEAVDAITFGWNGVYPDNRVPIIESLESSVKFREIDPKSVHVATIKVVDYEMDPLKYRWVIMEESKVKSVGGDFEATPKSYPRLIIENGGPRVKFKAPKKSGAYRLFAYVEDDNNGAATANIPFYVK